MGSGTLIIGIGGYLRTTLGNFLENSFQLGLASWRKDVTSQRCAGAMSLTLVGWRAICLGVISTVALSIV